MSPFAPFKKWEWGVEQRTALWPGMEGFRAGQIVTVDGYGEMRVTEVTIRKPTDADLEMWPDLPEGSMVEMVTFKPIEEPAQ